MPVKSANIQQPMPTDADEVEGISCLSVCRNFAQTSSAALQFLEISFDSRRIKNWPSEIEQINKQLNGIFEVMASWEKELKVQNETLIQMDNQLQELNFMYGITPLKHQNGGVFIRAR